MVRHHVKKNKKSRSKSRKEHEKELEKKMQDMDRFAGSSEEEDNDDNDYYKEEAEGLEKEEENTDEESLDDDDDDDDDGGGEAKSNKDKGHAKVQKDKPEKKKASSAMADGAAGDDEAEEEDGDDDDTSSDDEDEYANIDDDEEDDFAPKERSGSSGMANAMSRILGISSSIKDTASASKDSTKPVVLSKTITPLQKQLQSEKEAQKAFKLKRKERKERNLMAMHIPLSVATTSPLLMNTNGGKGGSSVARELEGERMHRRVATRGVVALFNAISKHQQSVREKQNAKEAAKASSASKTKKNEQVQSMTKMGFLDMLKNSAIKSSGDGDGNEKAASTSKEEDFKEGGGDKRKGQPVSTKKSSAGWNALKDDFMMNSKLKDWDKDLSDDESDNDDEVGDDEAERMIGRDGDILDDNLSDDDNKEKTVDKSSSSTKRKKRAKESSSGGKKKRKVRQ